MPPAVDMAPEADADAETADEAMAATERRAGRRVIYGSAIEVEQVQARRPARPEDVRRHRRNFILFLVAGLALFGGAIWAFVTVAVGAAEAEPGSFGAPLIGSILAGTLGFFGAFALGHAFQLRRAGPRPPAPAASRRGRRR